LIDIELVFINGNEILEDGSRVRRIKCNHDHNNHWGDWKHVSKKRKARRAK